MKGSSCNTWSNIISSFSPSIKALSYSREQDLNLLHAKDPWIVTVSMPTTLGQPPLSAIGEKVASIKQATIRLISTTTLERSGTSLVIAESRNCHAVHLARHELADAHDPSNSYLLLQKGGTETPQVNNMHVRDISGMNRKGAVNTELAYLSACSTASTLTSNF